jgi:small subunit ribosomal protein S20
MASHKSALKKQRQDKVSRMRNRSHESHLKSEMKKIRSIIAAGKPDDARKALRHAESQLDHHATLGIVHRNAAARTKSRLARQVAALGRS